MSVVANKDFDQNIEGQKIVSEIAEMGTNIKTVHAETFEGEDARISMIVSVKDREHLERVMQGMRKIKEVREVARHFR